MSKIRFAIIGGGWRAEFFVRIAKALPDIFQLSAVILRDEGKAAHFMSKFNVQVYTDFDKLLDMDLDYVVLSIQREAALEFNEKLFKAGIPVLCETPPTASTDELATLWDIVRQYKGKIQVAEQYFAQPLYAAWLRAVEAGYIGEVSNISISALHGYHGVNIIRRFLGVSFEDCTITGRKFTFPVVKTDGREGRCFTGEIVNAGRDRITFEFDNGKVAFYDFSGIQYASRIRTRQLNVQGVRGEIDDLTIRYLNSKNESVTQCLYRDDQGIYNNRDWSHIGLMLGDKYLYKSPFPAARLNDDEIAIASCMYMMKEYVDNGKEFYNIRDALQDSYFSFMMEEAVGICGLPVRTKRQVWYN